MHKLDEKALAAARVTLDRCRETGPNPTSQIALEVTCERLLAHIASLPSPEQSAAQQPATDAGIGTLRNSSGAIFWSDECQNPVAAIEFALDHIEDHYDRLEFLKSWREGDVVEWPDFIDFVAISQSPSKQAGGSTDENH